jgi:dimethylhistidine N-methyltransferase
LLRFIHQQRGRQVSEDPLRGLRETPPRLSPAYFYDALGARLFNAITELDEYYPTRLERSILREQAAAIARSTGQGHTMVDLGAGDCAKAMLMLDRLQPEQYVAIDIAGDFLQNALRSVEAVFPGLQITGVIGDFAAGLDWPAELACRRPLFFYPGSSIGNFSPNEACDLLGSLARICDQSDEGQGDLLIGIDLLKSPERMQAAYDDALGVTASFNLNMLRHLNRIAGSNFDVRNYRHQAHFNVDLHRMEMWLTSTCTQRIDWPDNHRVLREGESILTECSYKYTPQAFHQLLRGSGFCLVQQWFDASEGFLICHARRVRPAHEA